MRVEAMRPAAARIFRDRLGRAAFGMASAGALRRTLILRHWPRRPRYWRRRRCLVVRTAAETDRGQSLHQRHATLLGMIVGDLAALRPDLVLRGQRQLIDARHARRARHALRGRRDERRRHMRLGRRRFGLCRLEQRRLHRHRPDRHVFDRGRRQDGGRNRGMRGGFNGRRRVRRRRGPLDAVGDAPAVVADLACELLERAFRGLRLAHRDRCCRCRSPPRRRG